MSDTNVMGGKASRKTFDGAALISNTTPPFWEGKSFRAYHEHTDDIVIRVVASVPFLLTSQVLYADSGSLRAAVSIGGTPGGSFSQSIPSFGKNRIVNPNPVSGVVITAGGTVTGGTEVEVIRAAGAGGVLGTSQVSQGVRALPAGTYYISIAGTPGQDAGPATGLYSIEWDDLA